MKKCLSHQFRVLVMSIDPPENLDKSADLPIYWRKRVKDKWKRHPAIIAEPQKLTKEFAKS